MNKLLLVCLLTVLSSCSLIPSANREAATTASNSSPAPEKTISISAKAAGKPTELTTTSDGEPYHLRIENEAFTFCDKRGKRSFDLKTGRLDTTAPTCEKIDEPNTACSGLGMNVDVRAPFAEANEIIDINGWSTPLIGRVHDCASEGKMLAVATGSAIFLIDIIEESHRKISRDGGDRVAIDARWIAWSNGLKLHVVSTRRP